MTPQGKKEKKVLTRLFADADDMLFELLLSKCIITIRPEDEKEAEIKKENANEKVTE